jgi:hypothetical protein
MLMREYLRQHLDVEEHHLGVLGLDLAKEFLRNEEVLRVTGNAFHQDGHDVLLRGALEEGAFLKQVGDEIGEHVGVQLR